MLDSEKASLVAPNLDYVRERVAAASKEAGRSDVTLVAVSKLMELPILMQAYDHGELLHWHTSRACAALSSVPLIASRALVATSGA